MNVLLALMILFFWITLTSSWLGKWPKILFILPGTFFHELMHFLFALLLRGRPSSFSLIVSENKDGSLTLGSVEFYPSHFNGAFVALAPIWLLPLAVVGSFYLNESLNLIQKIGVGYLGGLMVYSSFPSKADWMIAVRYPAGLLVLGPIFYLLGLEGFSQVS